MPQETTRRELLAGLGLGAAAVGILGLSGCTSSPTLPPPARVKSADETAAAAAAERESALADRAERTARSHPTLTRAAQASVAHAAHAAALADSVRVLGGPGPSRSGAASPTVIPAGRERAARALAKAELAAAEEHRRSLAGSEVTGGLAALLGSVAGSDAAFARAVRAQAGGSP